MTQTVASIFEEMKTNFNSEKAAGMTASFQFNITGDDGGEWYADIKDGDATIEEGTTDSPTVTITATDEDWKGIVGGTLNPQMAFMQGKLKVQGDLGLATKLQSLFL